MMKQDNKILKPLQGEQRGEIEKNFYIETQNDEQIASIIPKYYGIVTLTTPFKCNILLFRIFFIFYFLFLFVFLFFFLIFYFFIFNFVKKN